jgi:hypothetical protein
MKKIKSKGEWIGTGSETRRVIPNQLQQSAFDMIGALFVGPGGPRPSIIGLADESGEIFSFRPASFQAVAMDPGPGVIITGTASFSSSDVSEDVHGLALVDNQGNILAEAILDPPWGSGQAFVATRRDTFVESD